MSRPESDIAGLFEAARSGHRPALARLLSTIERGGPDARQVGALAFPLAGAGYTIGCTGAPGAGKSTLTSRLVSEIRSDDRQVGVLAIDPSSPYTGGAILGDRIRMQDHALDDGVFIRSMATRGHLGGLALATPEAIRLLHATGRAIVVVETVGVGQVEVEVVGAADTTVVVVNPGWGDAVQANKAGLMEIADLFVINKADRPGVDDTRRDLEHMLDLSRTDGWRPPVVETIATSGDGVDELWQRISDHRAHLEQSGELEQRRTKRIDDELARIVLEQLHDQARALMATEDFARLRRRVENRQVDPWEAAGQLLSS